MGVDALSKEIFRGNFTAAKHHISSWQRSKYTPIKMYPVFLKSTLLDVCYVKKITITKDDV